MQAHLKATAMGRSEGWHDAATVGPNICVQSLGGAQDEAGEYESSGSEESGENLYTGNRPFIDTRDESDLSDVEEVLLNRTECTGYNHKSNS